jgi:hypothetical protein
MLHGEAPHGDFPLGDFDPSASLSIADALDNILSKPWLPRSWWLRALPRDEATSTNPPTLIPVDLSTDGHRTFPTDAEEIHLPEALTTPYSLQFRISRGLWGQSKTSFGQIVIGDASLKHRALAGHDWVGRQCDTYVGPRGGIQVQFARVARLLSRRISYDTTTLSIVADDHGLILDNPIQRTFFTGAGGLEGGDEIKGQPKPLVLGQVRHVLPILVDSATNTYQVHDGAYESATGVEDQGIAVTFNADVADITASTPPAGTYNTSLATGFIKFGTAPEVLTMDAGGHNSSALGFVNKISGLLRLLATTFAGLLDPSELDTVAFTALESHTAVMGAYITSPMTIRKVMEILHQSAGSFGWLQPNKILTVGRITDPDAATPDFTIDASKDEVRDSPWNMIPWEIPVQRVIVGYRRYYRTVDPTDLDSTKTLAERKDYCQDYRFATAHDAPTVTQEPEAAEITILTNIDTDADAQAFADEQLALRKELRRLGTVAPRVGIIKRGPGDVFSLIDNRLPDSPKKFVIVGVVNAAATEGRADNVVWECFG